MKKHDRSVRAANVWYKLLHKLTGRHYVRVHPYSYLVDKGEHSYVYRCEKSNDNKWMLRTDGALDGTDIDRFRCHIAEAITFTR